MHFSKSMRAFTAYACCASLLSQACVYSQDSSTVAPSTGVPITTIPIAVATPVPPLEGLAASPGEERRVAKTVDIELSSDRSLTGQLVNNAGVAIANAPIEVRQNGHLIQMSMTDQSGAFRLASLTGGTYEINVGDRVQTTRCWTSGSAPPQSQSSLRIVVDEEIVRAQQRLGAVCGALNPWIITGIVVAAVVIPVAIHNNRSDRPASN